MSLRDEMLKSGLVNAENGNEVSDSAQENKKLSEDAGLKEIADYFLAEDEKNETFAQEIKRANSWLKTLFERGYQEVVEQVFEELDLAVENSAEPLSEERISELESELKFELPPSYRQFLNEIGAVSFLNPWFDETTSPNEIVSKTKEYMEGDTIDFSLLAEEYPKQWDDGELKIVQVCDYHNGEGSYFMVCNIKEKNGESPIFLVFHEEQHFYGGEESFRIWFGSKIDEMIVDVTSRLIRAYD